MKYGPLKKFKDYLERITNPQSEGDYLVALNFKIRILMHMLTSEYRTGWAGIIEVGTEIDFDAVLSKLTPELLLEINQTVLAICSSFCVGYPSDVELPVGMQTFKEWYENTKIKADEDVGYPDFILEKLKRP